MEDTVMAKSQEKKITGSFNVSIENNNLKEQDTKNNAQEEQKKPDNADNKGKKITVFFSYASEKNDFIQQVKKDLPNLLIFESLHNNSTEDFSKLTDIQIKQVDCCFIFRSTNYLKDMKTEYEKICEYLENNSLKEVVTINTTDNNLAAEVVSIINTSIAYVIDSILKDGSKKSITKISKSLKERQNELKKKHNFWNRIGIVSMSLGIVGIVIIIGLYLKNTNDIDISGNKIWIHLSILLTFLIGVSFFLMYSFNIGKSYMNESLKMADRIHAIKSIQLFTELFHRDMDKEDLHKLFTTWNLANESSFKDVNLNFIDDVSKAVSTLKK